MRVKVKLTGLQELNQILQDLARAGDAALDGFALTLAREIKDVAVGNMTASAGSAPAGSYPHRQSGKLSGSIFAERRGKNGAAVGTKEIHGYYLEFGTESMAARPWLVPSFEEATRDAAAKLAAELLERI